jgi:hypothetical protein
MSITQTALVTFDEPDFTPQELGKLKKLHPSKIIRMFRDEPGVIRIGYPNRFNRKPHYTLRIPRAVAERVFARLTVAAR